MLIDELSSNTVLIFLTDIYKKQSGTVTDLKKQYIDSFFDLNLIDISGDKWTISDYGISLHKFIFHDHGEEDE